MFPGQTSVIHCQVATCRNVRTEKWINVTLPNQHININETLSQTSTDTFHKRDIPHSNSKFHKSVRGYIIRLERSESD